MISEEALKANLVHMMTHPPSFHIKSIWLKGEAWERKNLTKQVSKTIKEDSSGVMSAQTTVIRKAV